MNSRELADRVAEVVAEAQLRITGVGHEQYAEGDQQKFETMPLADLLTYFEEELLDQINYSVMNILRFRRYREQLETVERAMERAHQAKDRRLLLLPLTPDDLAVLNIALTNHLTLINPGSDLNGLIRSLRTRVVILLNNYYADQRQEVGGKR